MAERLLYCTPAWFEMLQAEAQATLDRAVVDGISLKGVRFALLERYRDAPEAFRPASGLFAGFRIDVDGTQARVRPGAADGETADLVLEISWEGANRIAGTPSGSQLDALMGELLAAGALDVQGSLDDFPANLDGFHDAVQARTRIHF